MKNILYLIVIVIGCASCEKNSDKNDEITKEQVSRILQNYGFEFECDENVGENGRLNFKTIEEFELYVKQMADQRDEYMKKHPIKDHHAILRTLETDRAKIDSMTKWVREGNFSVAIVKEGNTKSEGRTYNVPADSIEFYYLKMKEKERNTNK